MRQKAKLEATRGWERGNGESLFNKCGVALWDDEKVPEMDGDDGCTTLRIYLMPLHCTLEMAKMANFM